MTKEQIEKIFELGADAQYRYWNPEGDADVEGFENAKQDAVKLFFIPVIEINHEQKQSTKGNR